MYIPAHFSVTDAKVLAQMLRAHPLGMLVRQGPQGLDADHVPFELDESVGPMGTLRAHVARANPLWQDLAAGADVMVVFRGAEGYVSPNWYPTKHEAHRQVPTWNYEVVHAHGRLTVQDDERFVRGVVARLTRTHDAAEPKPWKMTESAPEYIDELLQKIVGIEVQITSLVGKAKLSQNKEARDRTGAEQGALGRGNVALADAMRKTLG